MRTPEFWTRVELLAEVERLRAEVERLREALQREKGDRMADEERDGPENPAPNYSV